ncbi:MAG: hypothetical protein P4L33_08520 [Capsulimonadaceae bacterium]|nr:hypothetical protein [Capsulimonadaceae bacterium]
MRVALWALAHFSCASRLVLRVADGDSPNTWSGGAIECRDGLLEPPSTTCPNALPTNAAIISPSASSTYRVRFDGS